MLFARSGGGGRPTDDDVANDDDDVSLIDDVIGLIDDVGGTTPITKGSNGFLSRHLSSGSTGVPSLHTFSQNHVVM